MKIFYEIIIQEINDKILFLKKLIDKLSKQTWNFYRTEHRNNIANLYTQINKLKQLKKTLHFNFAELSTLLYDEDYISSDEDELNKENRDFE